jgi:CRP-like cAMP-binding protein
MRNRLLSGMPPEDFALLATHLKEASPALGTVLQEAGEAVANVYFPQSGMLSMVVLTEEGAGVEVASIGREGAAGLQRGFGPRKAFVRTTVQVAGKFSFIAGAEFEKAVRRSDALREAITRYTEILWNEAQQTAACNALHTAEQRLCRWLLQTRDRLESTTLPLTQEFLAQMLGVRRTTVTLVAQSLQAAGLIQYRRGRLLLLNEEGLEDMSCECYRMTRHENLPSMLGAELPARRGEVRT